MAKWNEILSKGNEQLSDEDLLKYLDSKTSAKERHCIEKKLDGTLFESDAVEGLKQIKSPHLVKNHVKQLNKKLQQQLLSKKYRKQKTTVKNFQWTILAIVILLLICILAITVLNLS